MRIQPKLRDERLQNLDFGAEDVLLHLSDRDVGIFRSECLEVAPGYVLSVDQVRLTKLPSLVISSTNTRDMKKMTFQINK